jgi:hypothetical protein
MRLVLSILSGICWLFEIKQSDPAYVRLYSNMNAESFGKVALNKNLFLQATLGFFYSY